MTLLGKMFQDAAYATRNLFRARSFAIVVILTLALSGLSATQNASYAFTKHFAESSPVLFMVIGVYSRTRNTWTIETVIRSFPA